MLGTFFYVSLYMQNVLGYSPVEARTIRRDGSPGALRELGDADPIASRHVQTPAPSAKLPTEPST